MSTVPWMYYYIPVCDTPRSHDHRVVESTGSMIAVRCVPRAEIDFHNANPQEMHSRAKLYAGAIIHIPAGEATGARQEGLPCVTGLVTGLPSADPSTSYCVEQHAAWAQHPVIAAMRRGFRWHWPQECPG
jgi:hypothetical protein